MFTGQSEHSVAPVDAAIEPAGQDVHEEACAAENLPLAHATHLEAPLAEEYLPAGQSLQVPSPVLAWNVPAAHSEQTVARPRLYLPLGQVSHDDAPFALYLPSGQSEHDPCPVEPCAFPAA